ncbi:MAG TPA: sigma-70 family RNA polymerase sigma factor, partial [Acidimicrobiales bacterium]|nr:sigma-70 family RNA polymerase sigma factor [Acidimicrobiales bacterium]
MGSAQEPPEPFEAARPRLLGLAYRMLGSRADAEDVVQEAWLRWHSSDQTGIARPEAWLTTTTTRLALDRLRTVRRRREEHLGPWLPEPILTVPGPEDVVELAETLTLGFLTLLDRLDPLERAVVLLADVFDVDFADIAESVGRTPAACRQIASRARRRLRGAGRERVADHERRIVGELLAAL